MKSVLINMVRTKSIPLQKNFTVVNELRPELIRKKKMADSDLTMSDKENETKTPTKGKDEVEFLKVVYDLTTPPPAPKKNAELSFYSPKLERTKTIVPKKMVKDLEDVIEVIDLTADRKPAAVARRPESPFPWLIPDSPEEDTP